MKQAKNKFIYELYEVGGTKTVFPLGESDFSITWEKDSDKTKHIYDKSMGGSITFAGEAFSLLYQYEVQRELRCRPIFVKIFRIINGGTKVNIYTGNMYLNDGEWDIDRCIVKIKFRTVTIDQCIEDAKNDVIDLGRGIDPDYRYTTYIMGFEAQIEFRSFAKNYNYPIRPTSVYKDDFWDDGSYEPQQRGWDIVRNYYEETYDYGTFNFTGSKRQSTWGRYVTTSATPLEFPWINIGGNQYAKPLGTYDCVIREWRDAIVQGYTNKFEKQCRYLGDGNEDGKPQRYRNGLRLRMALPNLLSQICGLTVKSDFFQINTGPSNPPNYVTGETSQVDNIMVYQKRDIKFPNSSQLSTRMETTFEKFIGALCEYFNLKWEINEEGDFRIEHVSWFAKQQGMDLTAPQYAKYVSGKHKYSYETGELPEREKWVISEEPSYGDFMGTPIVYKSGCVTDGKNKEQTYTIQDVYTDAQYITEVSKTDGEKVSDSGVVLIAAARAPIVIDGGDVVYPILSEEPILGGNTINNTLSLAHLMDKYHRHNRPLKRGMMNLRNTSFETTKKVKKGVTITIPFCWDEDFDPNDLIKTMMGDGEVDSAKFRFADMMLELNLVYEALEEEAGAFNAKDITAEVVVGIPVEIDLGMAYDDNLNIILSGADITIPPSQGQIINTVGPVITYEADPLMRGTDFIAFKLRAFDGRRSNTALLAITAAEITVPDGQP